MTIDPITIKHLLQGVFYSEIVWNYVAILTSITHNKKYASLKLSHA